MSLNPLNDISKVYLEQVASINEARSIEHMRDRYLKDPKEIAKGRAKNIADRKKKRAALAHMEKQYAGMKAGIYNSYEVEGEIVDEAKKEKSKRWWDDDGDGIGYEKGEVSGKFKRKKVKEGFSNWRQDLSEVMDDAESNKKLKEKKVNNKIKINPNLGEAVEEIGGTLLEMVEIDEVDFIIESVYDELLEEGYEQDDIEDALEYALIEAKVTYGHDTDKPYEKKTGARQLVKAVGRLARKKLTSQVRDAKKSATAAVARGARKVAKGALGVARKMEGGDSKPSTAHTKTRSSSTYRGVGAGQKEKVSSGSYTPPTKKKAEKPADPWEGSATTPPKAKKTATPKATTKKAAAPKTKTAATPKRKRKSKLDDLLASVRNEEFQLDEKALSRAQQRFMGMVYAAKKGETPASPEVAKAAKGISKKSARDFAKTKHKGLPEVKEQMVDEPQSTSADPTLDKKKEMMDRQKLANMKMLQQKERQLQNQRMQMKKSGKLPLEAY